jgi:hypothetical protein
MWQDGRSDFLSIAKLLSLIIANTSMQKVMISSVHGEEFVVCPMHAPFDLIGGPKTLFAQVMLGATLAVVVGVTGGLPAIGTDDVGLAAADLLVVLDVLDLVLHARQPARPAYRAQRRHPVVGHLYVQV